MIVTLSAIKHVDIRELLRAVRHGYKRTVFDKFTWVKIARNKWVAEEAPENVLYFDKYKKCYILDSYSYRQYVFK